MKNYLKIFSRIHAAATPQAQAIANTVPNSAGGYAFASRRLDAAGPLPDPRLRRRQLLRRRACADARERRCRAARHPGGWHAGGARIVEISVGGRAPKNDPALFALALAARRRTWHTRRAALRHCRRWRGPARTCSSSPSSCRARAAGAGRCGAPSAPGTSAQPVGSAGLPAGEVSPAGRLVAPRPAAAGAPGDGRARQARRCSTGSCRGTESEALPPLVKAAVALGRGPAMRGEAAR